MAVNFTQLNIFHDLLSIHSFESTKPVVCRGPITSRICYVSDSAFSEELRKCNFNSKLQQQSLTPNTSSFLRNQLPPFSMAAWDLIDWEIGHGGNFGHGLFEVRPGQYQPQQLRAEEQPAEECKFCHRPSEGLFDGTIRDLINGKEQQCRLCDALYQFITAITLEQNQSSHPFRLEIRKLSPAILHVCTITLLIGDVFVPHYEKYQVFLQSNATRRPKSLAAFDNIGYGSPIAGNSRSYQCLSFADRSLQQCLLKHTECGVRGVPELPTRVLDLGEPGWGESSFLPLIEPPPGTKAQYAALSHCWGTNAMRLETTIENLESMKESIPLRSLPPTFQDAIDVARVLSIRYLWIDSLCIIQNSTKDWEVESSKMANIYRDAVVTIAAISSPSSNEYFLKKRSEANQSKVLLLGISSEEENEDFGIIASEVNKTPIFALAARPLAVHTKTGPLSERAWTFQEEKLSSRILYFSDTELSFQCRRGLACECDMFGAQYAAKNTQTLPLHGLAGGYSAVATSQPSEPKFDPFLAWQNRVAEYSTRKLTFHSDKLPALAGLATVCHDVTKSEYLAGLWRDHLILDLLWHPQKNKDLQPNIFTFVQEYRAPTFSWASVECPVEFRSYSTDAVSIHTLVLETQCTLKGLNPFGQVSDGFIKLRGPLIEVDLSTRPFQNWGSYTLKFHDIIVDFKADLPLAVDGTEEKRIRRATSGDDLHARFKGNAWCLSLMCSNGISKREVMVLGLSARVPGAYERLGLVDSSIQQTVAKLNRWFNNEYSAKLMDVKIV